MILVVAHEPTRCLGFQGFSTAIFSVKCSVYDISMTSETRETNPKHAPNEGLEPSATSLSQTHKDMPFGDTSHRAHSPQSTLRSTSSDLSQFGREISLCSSGTQTIESGRATRPLISESRVTTREWDHYFRSSRCNTKRRQADGARQSLFITVIVVVNVT